MNLNFTFKIFLLIFLSGLYPVIINVPGDYLTIQGALDASQDGDINEDGSVNVNDIVMLVTYILNN